MLSPENQALVDRLCDEHQSTSWRRGFGPTIYAADLDRLLDAAREEGPVPRRETPHERYRRWHREG